MSREAPFARFDEAQRQPLKNILLPFAVVDERKAELMKLRYFAGMSFEEAAEVPGIAVPTAKQWWTCSRIWLFREIANARWVIRRAQRESEHDPCPRSFAHHDAKIVSMP